MMPRYSPEVFVRKYRLEFVVLDHETGEMTGFDEFFRSHREIMDGFRRRWIREFPYSDYHATLGHHMFLSMTPCVFEV